MKLGSLLRHNITLGLSLENAENEIARLNRVIEAQRSETAEA